VHTRHTRNIYKDGFHLFSKIYRSPPASLPGHLLRAKTENEYKCLSAAGAPRAADARHGLVNLGASRRAPGAVCSQNLDT
jgi:hypothetical protein